ncbi:MAG: DNA-directed RNA polymerase subunit omega [Clostridia bacterium]|nr:DNA-directed RNA polymerase subunit omega [Clostridia bacterium]MBR6640571.1 DNA-directed RNA polymerase subunit omega [Clostridia bacterium]
MLAKPSVNDVMPKVGTRYEVALAVAKRARQISNKRVEEGDPDISDPVDVATKEIDAGKVTVAMNEQDQIADVIIEDVVE